MDGRSFLDHIAPPELLDGELRASEHAPLADLQRRGAHAELARESRFGEALLEQLIDPAPSPARRNRGVISPGRRRHREQPFCGLRPNLRSLPLDDLRHHAARDARRISGRLVPDTRARELAKMSSRRLGGHQPVPFTAPACRESLLFAASIRAAAGQTAAAGHVAQAIPVRAALGELRDGAKSLHRQGCRALRTRRAHRVR